MISCPNKHDRLREGDEGIAFRTGEQILVSWRSKRQDYIFVVGLRRENVFIREPFVVMGNERPATSASRIRLIDRPNLRLTEVIFFASRLSVASLYRAVQDFSD